MFGKLNKKTVKFIFWILVLTIVPSFVMWGSASIIRNRSQITYAGKIFGKKIEIEAYKENFDTLRNTLMISNPDIFSQLKDPLDLNPFVWERIIILHEAAKRKTKVSDSEVVASIQKFTFFQNKDGSFNNEVYRIIVQDKLGLSERQFEEQIRQSLTMQKLFDSVTDGIKIEENELLEKYKEENEKISIDYISFDPAAYEKKVQIQDKDLTDFYAQHKGEFQNLIRLNVAYIGKEYPKDIKIEDKQKITDSLNSLYKGLGQDKTIDLEKIAQDNQLTLKETGPFLLDEPIPGIGNSQQFLFTALSLKPDQLSQPLDIEGKGCFILKLKEKKNDVSLDFTQAKDRIKKTLINQSAQNLANIDAQDAMVKINAKLSQGPALDFKEACKSLGFESKAAAPFTRNTIYFPEIGNSSTLAKLAFSLEEKKASQIEKINGKSYIFKRSAIIPPDPEQFKKDKGELSKRILDEKKNEALQKFVKDLVASAKLEDNIPKMYEEQPKVQPRIK